MRASEYDAIVQTPEMKVTVKKLRERLSKRQALRRRERIAERKRKREEPKVVEKS